MRFLKLTIAYEGTDYVGWQRQPNGVSIQAKMEEAWQAVCQERVNIVASGRTDAGVHAQAQVCSLSTRSALDDPTLCQALNANLPDDIRVLQVETAADGFHAVHDCVSKTYRYQIQSGGPHDLFGRRFRWFIRRPLDVAAMRSASRYFVGKHDFASFQASGATTSTTVRTIIRLELAIKGEGRYPLLDLVVQADGFLYNMVRNLVGTLVEIGSGKQPPEWAEEVLASRDRKRAGPTAPPHGLFLEQVFYN